jgi:hypothetical protein
MAGQKTISCTHREQATPTPPPPQLIITGTPTPAPDCRGFYYESELYDGRLTYRRLDNLYTVWYEADGNYYLLSSGPGIYDASYWYKEPTTPFGLYTPAGKATGEPIASSST